MNITGTLGLGLRHLLVAAALVGAACVGYVAVTDAGGETPSSYGTMPVAKATYSGPSMSRSASSGMSSVAPSLRSSSMPHHSAAGAGGSYSIVSHMSSAAGGGQSVMTVDMHVAPSGFIGNGGGGSASNGFQSTSVPILAMAAPRSVSAGAVLAPRRANVLHGTLAGDDPLDLGDLTVYGDDKPGVITGQENSTLDNTVIDNLTEPIGDALWPLLLFAIGFACYKRKNNTQYLKSMLRFLGGKRSNACLIALCTLLLSAPQAWAGVEHHDYDEDGVDETYNVVYLNLSSGNNSKDGSSKANAVKTWAQAYSLLPAYTGTTDADRDAAWDSNIIVVCDIQKAGSLFIDETVAKGNGTKGIPATITGIWPWTAENTTADMITTWGGVYMNTSAHNNTLASGTTRIGADTKFKYIRFCGQYSYLSMYLHDCMFDVGCTMNDITKEITAENGALRVDGNVRKAPDFQVFLYANSRDFSTSSPDGGLPTQTKPVTLTIKSGKFGRILTNRLTGVDAANVKKKYVMGRPSSPFLCVVNVDIDPNTSTGAWNTRGDVYDIAYLCAGMTQGMVYSDVQFNIKRGTIGTLVAAMQGNSHTATAEVGISNSSFFGRTEVNINPVQNEDVTIYRYFATCFGRYTDNTNTKGTSNAAFYGKSTLNMHGGTIESGIYATAGGITGLKSPDGAYHTIDKFVPYIDAADSCRNYPFMGIKYQAYDANKTMPTFTTTLHGTPETIDLTETVTEMNIYGGIVNGGVFGGGYGFSPEMPAERAIAGAGSFWGETRVNIYGGTITGGVYGGGAGASNYFNASTTDTQRIGFSTVASVYGDTHVNIYGGEISGGIYGGGKGLDSQAAGSQKVWNGAAQQTVTCIETEFENVAKVYGNTNVTINPTDPSWTFNGDIYGGGALGAVEGNTNVKILGGIINGNVFGGGEGENGHPEKAKVTGSTNVTIGEEL